MVPLCSAGLHVSRPTLRTPCACPFHVRGYHPLWPDFPDCSTKDLRNYEYWAVPLSLATTDGISVDSIPPVTEMFQFTGFAPSTYVFSKRYLLRGGFPIRNLRIEAYLPAPRSLSQATTS